MENKYLDDEMRGKVFEVSSRQVEEDETVEVVVSDKDDNKEEYFDAIEAFYNSTINKLRQE